MKCLAIVTAGLGNIVETTPMLVALESVVDELHIGLSANWPDVDKLLPWPCIGETKDEYDVIVTSWWSRSHPFAVKSKQEGKKVIFSRLNVMEWSEVECNMDVARQLGFTGETPPPKLNEVGTSAVEGEYVILSPGFQKATSHANWNNKAWPHWKKFAELLKLKGYKLAIIGNEDECEEWHKDIIDHDLCGKTTTVDLAATLRKAKAVIGCDNGPAHVADAYRVPTIALYGPGSTIKNTYYQAKIMFMPTNIVPCRPCHHDLAKMSNCKNNICMKLINPEQVADVLEKELQNRKSLDTVT